MIKHALYLGDYLFEVTFYDQTVRVVNLEPFFAQKHPVIHKFANPELVKNFHLEDGTLCWGDNELDVNPLNLYTGKYDAQPEYVH
ncbi:MAG: DUF2442 domain-containing protein [Bacteroidales bacterium]|jgi:murein L,D-transpeptidase YafK|nr:DUF2442 domain-containing protein [Bacteroidales bacterium]